MNDLFPQVTRGMGSHQSAVDGTNEWLTPPELLRALGEFDLDPCSPIHRPWATADRHFNVRDDGLSKPWQGRVWVNPPYSDPIPWLARLATHGHGTALIFARTETVAWTRWVWPRASAILFLEGRITFCLPSGQPAKGNAGAPSALVAYGEGDALQLARCGIRGFLCRSPFTPIIG